MSEKQNTFSIKQWNEDDRPREKLMTKGKTVLSNAELLAILIGSGNRQESAVALSQRLLASAENNLNQLAKTPVKSLIAFNGIGMAKAISIVAAMELGSRYRSESFLKKNKITSSEAVFDLLQPVIGALYHEEFWVVYLNNSNEVLKSEQLSKGGITGTIVDLRLAYKLALEVGAVAIILAHNHPSGALKPSAADIRITKKIKVAGESLDIKVLDHLIITENAYFSFADENIL